MAKVKIGRETIDDHKMVDVVIREAFRDLNGENDCYEAVLVGGLRLSDAFIPELSLVAENVDGEVVGHILLTRIMIGGEHVSLALAPVSVLPECQGQGIGSLLIEEAHRRALELGYGSVVLLGHEGYYPRFGYKRLSSFGITMPIEAPDECCMAIELKEGALNGVVGMVEYPKEFMI